ncbi:MAG: hypothetical protein ABIJ05_02770 [Patescibacteria group bacterium]
MKLPSNIKVKRGLLDIFPFSKYTAQAVYPNIYLPKHVYENLKLDKPNPQYIATLKHEQAHIERAIKIGWVMWDLKYIFYPRFRFNEEIEAIKNSMKYLKRNNRNNIVFNTGKRAKRLSSWLYLWCVSYIKAKEKLDKAWNES